MHTAAKFGRVHFLRAMIEKHGFNADAILHFRSLRVTPLHTAVKHEQAEAVRAQAETVTSRQRELFAANVTSQAALDEAEVNVPILIGGKINQVPDGSNTSLPVDVSTELAEEGAVVCRSIDDLGPQLAAIARAKS